MNEKKYFEESPHARLVNPAFSECIACHGNHSVQKPSAQLFDEACAKCHQNSSPEFRLGTDIKQLMENAHQGMESAREIVRQASIDGLFVEDDEAILEEMHSHLVQMQPLQHTLDRARIAELSAKVLKADQWVRRNIQVKRKAVQQRKQTLALIWVFIAVMVSALWLKYNRLRGTHKK